MKTLVNPCYLIVALLFYWSSTKANTPGTVTIAGTSKDMMDNSISVRSINTFLNDRKRVYLASQRNQTGEFSLSFELKKPELVCFSAFYINWYLNIRPADSVTFKIVGKDMKQQLEFSGKEADRYNFDVLVSVEADNAFRIPSKSLKEYKELLDQWKINSDRLINNYLDKHKVDKKIIEAGKGRLNYQYVRSIYYTTESNDHKVIPPGYYKQAEKYMFNSDNLLNSPEYQSAIKFKYIPSLQTNLEKPINVVYQRIQSQLRGKTREYALALLTGEYSRKGELKDSLTLRRMFSELYLKNLESSYLDYLRDNEMKYFVIGKPLPANVLEGTILTGYSGEKSVNLAELLGFYKGKSMYIDLWASWCSPCRSDIEGSAEIKKFLSEKDVSVVYFSTDRDEDAWKKASEQDKITDNQFRFSSDKDNPLINFIVSEGIPRYIFLDKNHYVKTIYAPRPYAKDKLQFEKLIEEMNAVQ